MNQTTEPLAAPTPKATLPGACQAIDAAPIRTMVSSQACGLSQVKPSAASVAWRRVIAPTPAPCSAFASSEAPERKRAKARPP